MQSLSCHFTEGDFCNDLNLDFIITIQKNYTERSLVTKSFDTCWPLRVHSKSVGRLLWLKNVFFNDTKINLQ